MKDNESVLERIKKLLRMKHGGSTEEVETALLLAQKIALKHGIDINKVDENEEKREPITHLESATLSKIQCEYKYVAMIIDNFFNVRAFAQSVGTSYGILRQIVFVGTKTDIEIAKYIYNFLVRQFRSEWNKNRGRVNDRQNFMYGMYCGLSIKLSLQKPKSDNAEGMILISHALKINNYIDENFGRTRNVKVKPSKLSEEALRQGYLAGKNTNIRPAVERNKSVTLQLNA